MSDFEKHIYKIRKYFEEHKAERYPFENALLSEKDEYVKSLYFRMLCTLVRYTGEPSEMQVLYIRRLIAGSHAENKFQDYMRIALDLDTEDIDEFISIFCADDLKYYFCIDGMILLAVDESQDKNYELLAELIELLGITHDELVYLSAVVKAIVMQSSELLEEARSLAIGRMQRLSLYQYVHSFYHGAFVDETADEIHIYSYHKAKIDLSPYGTFDKKKVVIENVEIPLQADIMFRGCDDIIIKNCNVVINQHCLSITNSTKKVLFENSVFEGGIMQPITFDNCVDIQIKSCIFREFISRTIRLETVAEFKAEDTSFENCMYQYRRKDRFYNEQLGGVIWSSDSNSNGRNYYRKCSFINCGGQNKENKQFPSCISNCNSKLIDCIFKNCWNYHKNGSDFTIDNIYSYDCCMFWCDSVATNCEVINSARIFYGSNL